MPIHREAQIEAEMANDLETWQRIEDHVQQHILVHQQNAQLMQQMAPPVLPPAPGAPPGQGGPPPGLAGQPFAPSGLGPMGGP